MSISEKLQILLLGSGGRECALAYSIAKSNLCENYIAPGNGGTTEYALMFQYQYWILKLLKNFCLEQKIKIVVVGPELPLVEVSDLQRRQLNDIIVMDHSKRSST